MGRIKSISESAARLIVSLAEAKTHLRITHSDDDTYITALIGTARAMIENYTNRLWNDYEIIEVFRASEYDGTLTLKENKALEVTAVKTDNGTEETTVSSDTYLTNIYEVPAYIKFTSTPTISSTPIYPLIVEYNAGIAAAEDIPAPVKAAALLIIGHLYENRQDVVVGRTANELPKSSEYLLNPYKLQLI